MNKIDFEILGKLNHSLSMEESTEIKRKIYNFVEERYLTNISTEEFFNVIICFLISAFGIFVCSMIYFSSNIPEIYAFKDIPVETIKKSLILGSLISIISTPIIEFPRIKRIYFLRNFTKYKKEIEKIIEEEKNDDLRKRYLS